MGSWSLNEDFLLDWTFRCVLRSHKLDIPLFGLSRRDKYPSISGNDGGHGQAAVKAVKRNSDKKRWVRRVLRIMAECVDSRSGD